MSELATDLRAFMKVRASLDGSDAVQWFAGTVHAWFPTEHRQLFRIEGYNVARAVEADGGYDLLSREVAFYLDPTSNQPLERWPNPFTERDVEVLHIWNDPVNFRFRLEGPYGAWYVPVTEVGEVVVFTSDVFLSYPSPLPRSRYPDNSQDDTYHAAELFQFFARRADIDDPALASAPVQTSWTRLGPWLPWMGMGDRPGQLVYHCQGGELAGGFAALPTWLRERVEAERPEFTTAPSEFSAPNETSWTYFAKSASPAPEVAG